MSMRPTCQQPAPSTQLSRANARTAKASSLVQALKSKEKDNFDEVAEMARSAYHIARSLAETVNVEMKQHPVAVAFTSADATGSTPVTLNTIAQGVTSVTRVGDSIKLHELVFRYHHTLSTATVGRMRVVLYWDESNVVTSFAQLFDTQGLAPGGATLAGKTYDNRHLSQILYDHTSFIDSDDPQSRNFEFRININKHTQYDVGTSNIVTGALKLIYWADTNTINNNYITALALLDYTDD